MRPCETTRKRSCLSAQAPNLFPLPARSASASPSPTRLRPSSSTHLGLSTASRMTLAWKTPRANRNSLGHWISLKLPRILLPWTLPSLLCRIVLQRRDLALMCSLYLNLHHSVLPLVSPCCRRRLPVLRARHLPLWTLAHWLLWVLPLTRLSLGSLLSNRR